jgi:hypothetical protein
MRMRLRNPEAQDYQLPVPNMTRLDIGHGAEALSTPHIQHTLCRSRLNDSKDERRTVLVDGSDGRTTNKSKHTAGLDQTPGEACSK